MGAADPVRRCAHQAQISISWASPGVCRCHRRPSRTGRSKAASSTRKVCSTSTISRTGTRRGNRAQAFRASVARLGLPAATLDAITDWIDTDSVTPARRREDAWLHAAGESDARGQRATRCAPPSSRSFAALSPEAGARTVAFVVALPTNAYTPLNVNTRRRPYFAAAVTGLSDAALPGHDRGSRTAPYSSVPNFARGSARARALRHEAAVTTSSSSYFLVTVRARQATSRRTPARC